MTFCWTHPTDEEKKIVKRQYGGGNRSYKPPTPDASASDKYINNEYYYYNPRHTPYTYVPAIANDPPATVKPSAASAGASARCECSAVCAAVVNEAMEKIKNMPRF